MCIDVVGHDILAPNVNVGEHGSVGGLLFRGLKTSHVVEKHNPHSGEDKVLFKP